ncbi:A-kinase anchor protein 9 [Mactra antiquata]
MGNSAVSVNRRHSAFIESNMPPPDMSIEIISDGGSSGTTTPPVIIEMIPSASSRTTSDKEDSATFIQQLHRRLSEEHRQIIQKIESDLEKSAITHHHTRDSQTDDTVSVSSEPVTESEIKHVQERQQTLHSAQGVQKSLDKQLEEINALRSQMLGEYEQMLSVRAEVMASQSEEVEKLQQEMTQIQQQYETQMNEFQDKVQSQTESSLKASHEKELEDMKQYYEAKVTEMEQSYTTDIAQLKQEHNELIARLQQETDLVASSTTQQLPSGKQREYVHRTTTLTAISDDDEESPPATPATGNEMLEGRIKVLEEKLKDKEKLVSELKKRFEAEATSAEDLHGKLLDSNKTLDDYEESLRSKGDEIAELKKALSLKDDRISELENEKAALEERGEKEKPESDTGSDKLVEELKERISKLEEELSASKETNNKISEELNQLSQQHGEAIVKLKEEMSNITEVKLQEAEAGFQIQLDEELKQQADEIENKFREELDIYKKTESELKLRLSNIQLEHDQQLSELREKYEEDTQSVEKVVEHRIEAEEAMDVQAASSLDRESIEAAIRENVRAEILKEYEESIDKLKSEYEQQISDMNTKIQSYEAQDIEKAELADKEKLSEELTDSDLREKLKSELAYEFKERLQNVTDEYETKLKKLQEIVDGRKELKSPSPPYALARSRSLDLVPQKEKPKSSTEYDGYVATIRKEYEDKINSLQMQIAQYRSTVGSVPSTLLSPMKSPQSTSADEDSGSIVVETPKKASAESRDSEKEVYESSIKDLKESYDKQLMEVSQKLSDIQAEGGTQSKDYEAIIEKLKQDYENEISELKEAHANEIDTWKKKLEKSEADKLAAEQKVKADMFVWHEEIVSQLKRKHEEDVTQLRKEYEEKMDLYREELQEEVDAEKEKMVQSHKREIAEMDERYDNLVEGIRSGDVPEVSEMFQEKYDLELEMAKTLIQQECDETIESEQSRISEQYEEQIETIVAEKEKELQELRLEHERALTNLKESLLQQYQSQTVELESAHQEAILKLKAEYEVLLGDKQTKESELGEKKAVTSEKSVDEETEKEDESEKVTSPDTTSKSDRSDDDDDDNGDGKGGPPAQSTSPSVEQFDGSYEQEQDKQGDDKDDDNTRKSDDTSVEDKPGSDTMTVLPDSTVSVLPGETDKSTLTPVCETVSVENVTSLNMVKPDVTKQPDSVKHDTDDVDDEIIDQLRKELAGQVAEYVATIAQMKASHEQEINQLKETISKTETEYQDKINELVLQHKLDVKQYQESIDQLRQGVSDLDDSEALEAAHQQELLDLEERLVQKHMNELNNLETQHQSKIDEITKLHNIDIEQLQQELIEAQRSLEQYPDVISPTQTVPTFQVDSSLGSTKESTDDFMVPTGLGQTDTDKSETRSDTKSPAMETQKFDARSVEDRSEEDVTVGGSLEVGSLQGTLEDIGVKSLDTSMDQSRGTLRGIDTTQDTDLIEFCDEDEEEDKSIDEGTGKTDRSSPGTGAGRGGRDDRMKTLDYDEEDDDDDEAVVKSLDDTIDSSIYRQSDRDELIAKIKELEGEVDNLRQKLAGQINIQDDQMERLAREKQEENNLVDMLRGDVDRLNNDRDALQSTNEHLLGLLSDAVKTYMSVEDTITKKMKSMMEKSSDKSTGAGRPGSAERKRTPPPGKKSPSVSPGRLSPARVDDQEGAQDTSIVSNITDEGLDLSQRFTDSIFQGPDLATEEEELLIDSGSRLRTSVNHLLDMIEESTNQLIENRHTHSEMLDAIEGKGHDFEHLTSRCSDLEERLKEEVERKDFLVLELNKAEGLIEGYSTERESLDEKIQELNEQKETLVLELETTRNKLHDLQSMQVENVKLKKEMEEQRDLMTHNVGEEAQALMLEVTRLNSENREKEEQFKQVQERYESRVRQLETSGEDMESHYGKILDERKQEIADFKLHVEALEKQLKAKKQFLEEQSSEREQEHEEYQKEIEKWKKIVQDLEKQNGTGSRLQREIDDLNEQLQIRIDLHNQSLLDSERYQHECRDKDASIKELKTIISQLEQDIQEKNEKLDLNTQKIKKLEEELSRRPYTDDEMSDTGKSGTHTPKSSSSIEFDGTTDQKKERSIPQMTVEEEMRQAANKTKEELVREKFTLQTQVNENLVQLSSLRTQLDDMRHRRGLDIDIPEVNKRLEAEREKSEEKDKEISDLKLNIEELTERIENREQQIEQLRDERDRGRIRRGSPVEGIEFENDRETEKQMEALKRENKQLRERVKLSEASSVTDISGLSQNLLEEKNQEIDHLAEQILRLQSDYNDLKAEKGVQNVCEELEDLRDELQRKEKEIYDLQQNVRVSQAFTDHSLTPDSSLLNVGASFSEKASIQQEMQESVANGLEKMASLETEVASLKETLHSKEEEIVSLQTELSSLREDLQGKDEMILALQDKPISDGDLIQGLPEDPVLLQTMIQEKEELVTQLTVQVDSLQSEVDNLSDFQTKLQEDFDIVQTMLEEKDREIESLTRELTDRSALSDQHSLVIKHEVEIARLKKDLREKDNVVEEKLEELAEMSDKVELLESHINNYKEQVKDYDDQILDKDKEIKKLKKQYDEIVLDDKDSIISEKTAEIERLNKELETAALGPPPSPPLTQDEKSELIKEQTGELESLRKHVQSLLGRPPSPPRPDDEKTLIISQLKAENDKLKDDLKMIKLSSEDGSPSDVVQRLRTEIEKLKQQLMDANLSEDDKFLLIRDLRLENDTLKRQIDAALKIRPPSPPLDEDEKSELIQSQKKEIETLKKQVEAVITESGDEKSQVIVKQEKEIRKLQKQVEEALQILPPPPPLLEDEKDRLIEQKETEIVRIKSELDQVIDAIENGDVRELLRQKIDESLKLKTDLDDAKYKLENSESYSSSKELIEGKDIELQKAFETVQKLEEELQSAKEVKAYEDEIALQEKQDEIDELQAELDSYREKSESVLIQSSELEMSLGSDTNPKELVRSLSFYKQQYEEKCSESRQLQVQLDLAKQQTEKGKGEQSEEDTDVFFDLMKKDQNVDLRHENEQLKKKLVEVKSKLEQSVDERIAVVENELQVTKNELAKERLDNVQAIKDIENLRDRKEKERRGSVKTIQELELTIDEKDVKEKELNTQVKQLSEELAFIKKQYGIEDKTFSRGSPKELKSHGSFELSTDIETLQQQVIQYKHHADKARDILSEKQKYQSQAVKLEIQYEQLQKQMKKEVGQLEEQLKSYAKQPDKDVWTQLHATQERLEKTTEQLQETGKHLSETESNLQKVSNELAAREGDMRQLQEDLWKTSGQLSVTSGKLQEVEEKLRITLSQVSEREDQIHQLQAELQHSQQEVEKVEEKNKTAVTSTAEVDKLRKELHTTKDELEKIKKSLNEAVEMSEQQLQMVENKDEEYIKLKLDIQQSLADKDKAIKEQRNKIKEQEKELVKVRNEVKQESAKVKQEVNDKDELIRQKDVELGRLREELSSQSDDRATNTEVTTLHARLQNQEELIVSLRSELSQSQSTIDEQRKDIENIEQSHKELMDNNVETVRELRSELAVYRSAAEERERRSASHINDDNNADREVSPFDQNGRHVAGGESVTNSNKRSNVSGYTDGRSPSADLYGGGDGTIDDVSKLTVGDNQEDSGHQSFDPSGRDPQFSPEGQSLSPRQLRPYVAETVEEVMISKDTDPSFSAIPSSKIGDIEKRDSPLHSPPTRDGSVHSSPKSTTSKKSEASNTGKISPTEQIEGDGTTGSRYSPTVETGRITAQSYTSLSHPQETAASTSGEDNVRQSQDQPISDDRLSNAGRLSYDRDDNIRPHYSHSVEAGLDQGQTTASPDLARSPGEGQGMSTEAERYIQQLRRELLITKTALMQIQRGERLEDDVATPDDDVDRTENVPTSRSDRGEGYTSRSDRGQGDVRHPDEDGAIYEPIESEENLNRLKKLLEKAEEELTLYRSSSTLSARDFVQKVMDLKDELSSEHQRHIQELSARAVQDTETQLATMRIKYTDEIEHLKKLHGKELEEKLREQKLKMERKHKSDVNKLSIKHQEEVGALKLQIGADSDGVYERGQQSRYDGVGSDRTLPNGHGTSTPMSEKLQNILRRLHNEGVQVLTLSELEYLNRNQSQRVAEGGDLESMKAGWENERQTMLSTIQSLKDLLSQTHKLRGLDKTMEGSDWRAELLRCIGYVFSKERETLLAELRSHVLAHPSANLDEIQRLEQKIRTMESHHHAALDQVFNADRQSMLAEIRDLRAHATITRMHQQEEKDRLNEKVTNTEDQALKKERQLKREVQLLEFKIQQEKVLQEDLRLSLDSERNRSGELSGLLNQEKTVNLDLQTSVSALQSQVAKLRENLEREQSRYVSVTNALEEEKSKSLNLSDLLESERETLHRVQAELDVLKNKQNDSRVIEELQYELNTEREKRCQADSQHEIDMVTLNNLQQELEMGNRRHHAMETELNAKIGQLQRAYDMEKQTQSELSRALEREKTLSADLQRSLQTEQSQLEKANSRDRSIVEHLQLQLETERANLDDLNRALVREQKAREESSAEKNLIKDHLNQERALNEEMKRDLDKVQFERLEAVNKLQKEREFLSTLKSERDQLSEDLRKVKSVEIQRDHAREEERLSIKKSIREAERTREEYRMKLHEQELETQRLTQKLCGLEDELTESRENELKAIRDVENIRLQNTLPVDNGEMVPDVRSPRHDISEGSLQDVPENYHVYRSQLESMCQSLHYLILRCREQLNKVSFGGVAKPLDISDFDNLQQSLRDLLSEVKQLQEMEGEFMSHPSGSVNERILRQNEELTNYVARISEEKTELRNTLTRLEEEIWRYRQMDAKYQDMQRRTDGSDHQLVAERAEWAREKLSLQMSLNSAEREIGLLQTDLRVERERRVAAGITETKDNDKIKIQRLYGKYLRAESFRKALIYQKKYLLLLLGGFQDTEETTLVLLSRMGAVDNRSNIYNRQQRNKPLTTFRGAVRVVIAIQRMKFLVKKWRRATRVGSEVVGGTVDQSNGYVPQSSSYSPPRNGTTNSRTSSIPVRSSSSPPVRSTYRSASPYRTQSPVPRDTRPVVPSRRFDIDTYSSSSCTSPRPSNLSHVPSTPPTKDYNSTTKYTSPSSGARRKILTSSSIPAPKGGSHVRFTSSGVDQHSSGSDLGDTDDYIHRLESLQNRLGTLQNGKRVNYRQAWR